MQEKDKEGKTENKEFDTYNGGEEFLFISYPHPDSDERVMNEEIVKLQNKIIKRLQKDGYRIWYDKDLHGGEEWDIVVSSHIRNCACFISLISGYYFDSENCRDELFFAKEIKKKRVLVYLEKTTLPDEILLRHGRLQAVKIYDFNNEDEFFAKLFMSEGFENCCSSGTKENDESLSLSDDDINSIPKNTEIDYDSLEIDELQKLAENDDPTAQYKLANRYYNGNGVAKNINLAFELTKKSAEQGNNEVALNNLGVYYQLGEGVPKDEKKAVELYKKSADKGCVKAEYNLGHCYYHGTGTDKDYDKAAKFFKQAAEKGDAGSQYWLGYCYNNGNGVPKDYTKAAEWYTKAAEQNNADAQYRLGLLYYWGRGIEQNYKKAAEWYKKAAEQGNSGAQYNLGLCYRFGYGVNRDLKEAEEWFTKASKQGSVKAQNQLDEIKKRDK